eukprot:CAMPEP_0197931744 /NCGR_PEP_ID=MMETSP1439-20131203/107531_1 /TAXON_ID=66791 /ORGANISM="Gonyaulax spinifera, Strain CCMP409" /LENGTH=52 /DNA_ID=CAMNT_0043554495 /DNA_START=9 /DNA_END=167 /DNA_ORIENTATION=-
MQHEQMLPQPANPAGLAALCRRLGGPGAQHVQRAVRRGPPHNSSSPAAAHWR